MAQCPRDGTLIDLTNPSVPKKCSCPVCGSWVYPHLMVVVGTVELTVYRQEALFGRADVSGSSAAGSVSRNHARFYPTEEGWSLVSLSERTVSEVNGRVVEMLPESAADASRCWNADLAYARGCVALCDNAEGDDLRKP